MSNTSQMLNFQRYEARVLLKQHHQDQWQTLNEMHSIESKALETYLSQAHDTFLALYENHITIMQASVENFEDPTINRSISLDEQLDTWKTGIENNQKALQDLRCEKKAQIETLTTKQQKELDDLSAKQVMQSQAIENSSKPLQDVKRFVGNQEYDTPEPAYKIPQPGLGFVQQNAIPRNSSGIENTNFHEDRVENTEPKNSLEQAHYDLSKDKPTSPFDEIEKYKDLAKNDFNQASDPFAQEQSTDMER